MSALFEHTIAGDPIPKGRPRADRRGHFYTPPRTRAAEKMVAQECYYHGLTKPLEGPLVLTLGFEVATHRRVDGDNLQKLVMDALNHVAWHDDSQVEEWHVTLDRGRPPGSTHIRIEQRQTTLF